MNADDIHAEYQKARSARFRIERILPANSFHARLLAARRRLLLDRETALLAAYNDARGWTYSNAR